MMAKQRKRRSRRKLPWPSLGDPISCHDADWSKEQAEAEQYNRMIRLKDHFKINGTVGWKPWYQLALAIGAKFDAGLRIVPHAEPNGQTAPRWKGAHYRQLRAEVDAIQRQNPDKRERWCVRQVFELLPYRYGDLPDFETFYKRYIEAKSHHV